MYAAPDTFLISKQMLDGKMSETKMPQTGHFFFNGITDKFLMWGFFSFVGLPGEIGG